MATDRTIIKDTQKGHFRTAGTTTAIADPSTAVEDMHKRALSVFRIGTENADTNIAETCFAVVNRKSKIKSIKAQVKTSVAGNATNYLVITCYKRDNSGANQTLLGSWNTHTSAQSSLTAFASHALSLTSTNADLTLVANSVLTFLVRKVGTGQTAIAEMTLTADAEEV